MGQITNETIAMIRRAVDAGQRPSLTLWEYVQLAWLAERQLALTHTKSDALDAAVLSYLDDLKDDAAAHIFPDDLERCMTSECAVQVASVRMGSPDGMTVPLFSRAQVVDALNAAMLAASQEKRS